MKRSHLLFCSLVLAWGQAQGTAALPTIHETLVAPPQVPPPITRKSPARVVVDLTVEEVERDIAPGTSYTFWTFGGSVPGRMIRVREGDTVELHLHNLASNKLPHNIDLHAVSGPGGGAPQTLVAPGKQANFTFKALQSGLYVYHCATAPVGMHVGNGMYGMILVEPLQGLPKVDREYYVMQGDFYTSGAYRAGGLQPFDMQKAIDEKPTYVLFNGADGALTGQNALPAKTGEKIRLFFGDGGPNLTSSFHVIGAIMDKVYTEGGTHYQQNVQTTMVPAGGSAIIEFTTRVPGKLTLVDHSLTRAFNKGAIGLIDVAGANQPEIYGKGIISADGPAGAAPHITDSTAVNAEPPGKPQATNGKTVFETVCAACHQATALGIPGVFPPLAGSDFFKENLDEAARIVLGGRAGPITVKGVTYNSVMPPQSLTDQEIAAVLNYVSKEFNDGKVAITPERVRDLRTAKAAHP
ncbi:copper-containing nitrite reductase [Paludibacterium purpuratum]|uniref:Copper-containing nitrite reductase n=1 Tax=Paludibacterium purpuratum TaxID=1144873 RepID=A0A4R7B132_9NEIS|nr:copper-containing nitrite reductase [Paludibacterium purpuratum]TDR76632.1 dissimilatory nitrite reductase (NO-forming) copper type apoprotein [Paludibacterium purpuratum]